MPEGVLPRMAIEWGFLILLAVGAAVADLRPVLIILVMAGGWLLVVLVELLAWRAQPSYVVEEAEPVAEGPVERVPRLPEGEGEPPPLQPPLPPAYDFEFERPGATATSAAEDTAVSGEAVRVPPADEEDEERTPLEPDDPYAPAPERERLREADQRVVHRLEPLKPRPRRRWFRRGE